MMSVVSNNTGSIARAYLLHLVGCIIFVNKSTTSICVSYLLLFRDLHACGGYAFGIVALAHMYEQLGDVNFVVTKQMVRYLTLFTCTHILCTLISFNCFDIVDQGLIGFF